MITPNRHPKEFERQQVLERYKILDTMAEQAYDDITKIAAAICGTSIAVISLVDKDRQWFKSAVGLGVSETPRDIAFCAHAILDSNLLIVNDATKDNRFHDNPLVTDAPFIRFYAGAQLQSPEGLNLGTLCVIDPQPMELSANQYDVLRSLSRQVMMLLELRYNLSQLSSISSDLKNTNDKMNQLVGIVAHDLRNPLGNIHSLAEMIDETTSKNELEEYIRLIKLSSSSCSEMVQNILEMSALETGKIRIQKSMQSVKELFNEAWRTTAHLSEKKSITALVDGDDAQLLVDRQRIIQTLCNLLTNAIKFSHPGSIINFTISADDSQVTLSIRDKGVGMSDKQIRSLFDPTKATSTMGTSGEVGTGYGLPLVAQIVSLHGGIIEVKSEESIGSEFLLKFPRKTS